jgi:hypothetical protein
VAEVKEIVALKKEEVKVAVIQQAEPVKTSFKP